jgi:hypothetical protein
MSCLGEHWFDFGIIGEGDVEVTPTDEFTVRNIGNVPFNVLGKGVDAQSQPGEPTARWELEISPAMNIYALGIHPSVLGLYSGVITSLLDDGYTGLWTNVPEGAEVDYGAAIAAPTIITTPARMWTRILLIVVATP